jgi:uncharacterized protein (TIGR03067 family)
MAPSSDGTTRQGTTFSRDTWQLRWHALPPTLVLTCKTSDYSGYVGEIEEVKLVQLDNEALALQYPGQEQPVRYARMSASGLASEELEELQGAWVPLQYEVKGQRVEANFKQTLKGDSITLEKNSAAMEGKVAVDPNKNPKHLDFQFTSGQTDLMIYVRTGDYVICCGNRNGKTRPAEFATGTAKGGEYLLIWKIQR